MMRPGRCLLCGAIMVYAMAWHGVVAHADSAHSNQGKKGAISVTQDAKSSSIADKFPADTVSASELFRRGYDALVAKKYEDATYLFEEGLALEPDEALAHVYLGEGMLGVGRFVDAIQEFEKARISDRTEKIEKSIGVASREWHLSRGIPESPVNPITKRKYVFNWSDKLSNQLKNDPLLTYPAKQGKKYRADYEGNDQMLVHGVSQLPNGIVREFIRWNGRVSSGDRVTAVNFRNAALAGLVPLNEVNDRASDPDPLPSSEADFISYDFGIGRVKSTGRIDFELMGKGGLRYTAPYSYWQFQFVDEPLVIEGRIFPLTQGNSFSVSSGSTKIVQCKVGPTKLAKAYSAGFTGEITLLACRYSQLAQRYYWGEVSAVDPDRVMVYHPEEMVYYLHDAGIFLRYPAAGKMIRGLTLAREEIETE